MNKPLVEPISGAEDAELNRLIAFYEETLGFCPNSVKTMYIRPAIAYAFIEMNKAVMQNAGNVSSALKRLIGFVASNTAGCSYCQAHTIRAAERYGANDDQLSNIWNYKHHPAFSAAEKAALDFAIASSSIPNAVDDQIAGNLRQYWDDGDIVEMLGVIALFGFLNRWNDSMGTEMEAGAVQSGTQWLSEHGWTPKKHEYPQNA
jgi:uncharacterized peroxidase-related enzyme